MPRSLWILVIGMAINVTGSSFLWPLNTIYIHDHLGKSLSVAGFVLMLNAGASVIGNLFGGMLFDKVGGYKAIMLGIVISLLSLLGLVFSHGWPAYPIFLTMSGFGVGIIFPAMFAMAGSVWPEGGRKPFNALYVSQNLGVAVGSALGGFVASFSFDYIFMANAFMYVLFLLIAFFGYRNIQGINIQHTNVLEQSTSIKNHSKINALMILCIGYLLCWVCYVQWQTTIASYTQDIHITLRQYSFLWTINGALIVLGQPFLTPIIRRFARKLKTQILIGMVIFIISYFVVAYAEQFTAFLVGMIILTIGEMFVWPAVPTVANNLAPKGKEGFYQGIVNSTATGGRMIGPLAGGILVDAFGMNTLFYVLIVLIVISMVTTFVYDRNLEEKKSVEISI